MPLNMYNINGKMIEIANRFVYDGPETNDRPSDWPARTVHITSNNTIEAHDSFTVFWLKPTESIAGTDDRLDPVHGAILKSIDNLEIHQVGLPINALYNRFVKITKGLDGHPESYVCQISDHSILLYRTGCSKNEYDQHLYSFEISLTPLANRSMNFGYLLRILKAFHDLEIHRAQIQTGSPTDPVMFEPMGDFFGGNLKILLMPVIDHELAKILPSAKEVSHV